MWRDARRKVTHFIDLWMQSKENATKMVMMTTIPQWIICSCWDFFANLYMYNFSIILWSVGCKCQIYGTIIQKRFSSLTIPLFCLVCFFLSVFGGTLTLCRNVVLFFYLFQYAIVCLCFCASSCICSQYTIHMYTNSKCV